MAQFLAALIFIPLILGFYSLLIGLPGALFLRLACSLLGEKSPSFGRAVKITAVAFWVLLLLNGVIVWVGVSLDQGLMLCLCPISLPAAIGIYAKMLPLRFGRAVVLAATQVIVLVGGILVTSCFFNVATWVDPSLVRWLPTP